MVLVFPPTYSGDIDLALLVFAVSMLIGRRVVNGNFTDQDRDRLTGLVAAEGGIGKEEAARRVARRCIPENLPPLF